MSFLMTRTKTSQSARVAHCTFYERLNKMGHGDKQKANEGSDAYTKHKLSVRHSHYKINLSVLARSRLRVLTASSRYCFAATSKIMNASSLN